VRRKTLYITDEQNRRLKELAAEADLSRNVLIRRALVQYLKKASVLKGKPEDRRAQA
jgi:predicted transcriptional regulator